ncbi:hypothetical protein JOC77_004090 [Peribacillus deserti]|uniref:Uncharacterized protein n=1 Tax=Peribacillus deserti TaxID=673318 RepID=A0ABS2QNV9_9BACI|nr:hypothetical protein [Peribacillus deserti]MBM7694615.1 hypothetical protein [Peribacillus deserti]
MREQESKELVFVPTNLGMLKAHINGFERPGQPGEIFIRLRKHTIRATGTNKRKTLNRSIIQLNHIIAKK